jgi:hypothetical protein
MCRRTVIDGHSSDQLDDLPISRLRSMLPVCLIESGEGDVTCKWETR